MKNKLHFENNFQTSSQNSLLYSNNFVLSKLKSLDCRFSVRKIYKTQNTTNIHY